MSNHAWKLHNRICIGDFKRCLCVAVSAQHVCNLFACMQVLTLGKICLATEVVLSMLAHQLQAYTCMSCQTVNSAVDDH